MRRLSWLVVALALVAAACTRPPAIEARPALWRASDGDTTIWLLGSIHALPPGTHWQTPAIDRAVAAADTLILEVPPAPPDAARQAFMQAATRPGLAPLLERVDVRQRALLDRAVAAAGGTTAAFDRLTTWGAALAITAAASGDAGADGAEGVEAVLARRFAADGKPVGALETRSGQFALFDRLPEASQRALLMQAAADSAHPRDGYRALLSAWAAGDAAGLARTLDPLLADRAIRRALVTERNRRWAGAIVRRLARPGTMLIAVGAGHLVGPESVPALLRSRGVRVDRVE